MAMASALFALRVMAGRRARAPVNQSRALAWLTVAMR